MLQAAEEAEDLLLFYHTGHGFIGRRGELYPGLTGTRPFPSRLPITAMPFGLVADAYRESPARCRVVILDTSYSGLAIEDSLAAAAVLDQLEVAGTYTLTASTRSSHAMAIPGERHTAFTGRLLDLLHSGVPEGVE